MLAYIENETPVRAGKIYRDADDVQHVTRALDQSWTDADLAAIGLHRIERVDPPEGETVTGRELEWNGATVHEVPILKTWTAEELQDHLLALIRAERDRRLGADFAFQEKMYQRDPDSLRRIAGAAQIASLAIAAGAQPGNHAWVPGSDTPFGWIATDDSVTLMDAQTTVAFGMAAAAVETRLIFAAHALRNMGPIPENFTDDAWWGAA